MRYRQTITFPDRVGDTVLVPKRNESFRIVSVFAIFTPATATKQLLLQILDGASNQIIVYPTIPLPIALTYQITFADAPVDSATANNVFLQSQNNYYFSVPISDELWIQPQWQVKLTPSVLNAGDTLTSINVLTESFSPSSRGKSVARDRGLPEDSDA